MAESLPLYGPGYTISEDRYGNLVDTSASLTERWCALGVSWRIDSGYKTLAADGNYLVITFTTPATGRVFYNFATVNKSGNECIKSLFEGCTVANGTAVTPVNYNRSITTACPLTAVKVGLSTDGSPCTITGGTEMFISLVPGTAQGNSRPGGSSQLAGVVILKQNTVYALKVMAKGGAATLAADVGMGYIATAL